MMTSHRLLHSHMLLIAMVCYTLATVTLAVRVFSEPESGSTVPGTNDYEMPKPQIAEQDGEWEDEDTTEPTPTFDEILDGLKIRKLKRLGPTARNLKRKFGMSNKKWSRVSGQMR
eukprot:GHVS01044956.1.p1 GENE.GHVS01044956.1~~GHVS01044956.1.p1  ORF type:complete len:115 (-),score=6.97 GHVS01044956.1:292-636(-)